VLRSIAAAVRMYRKTRFRETTRDQRSYGTETDDVDCVETAARVSLQPKKPDEFCLLCP